MPYHVVKLKRQVCVCVCAQMRVTMRNTLIWALDFKSYYERKLSSNGCLLCFFQSLVVALGRSRATAQSGIYKCVCMHTLTSFHIMDFL